MGRKVWCARRHPPPGARAPFAWHPEVLPELGGDPEGRGSAHVTPPAAPGPSLSPAAPRKSGALRPSLGALPGPLRPAWPRAPRALPGPDHPVLPQCARTRRPASWPPFPSQDQRAQPRGQGQGLPAPRKEPVSAVSRGNGEASVAPRTGDPGSGRAHGDAGSSTPCENAPSGAQAQPKLWRRALPFHQTQASRIP